MATQTFTSSGTWTCPAWVTSVRVQCYGKGYKGETQPDAVHGGLGGGGGAYAESTVKVYQNQTYLILIPDTSQYVNYTVFKKDIYDSISKSLIAAQAGGEFGGGAADQSYGTIKYNGGNGGGRALHGGGGGGGGGAGTTQSGSNGSTGIEDNGGGAGGNGGSAGGGAGGNGGDNSHNGGTGNNYGGGGGGSWYLGGSGGAGGAGAVILTWTVNTNVVLMNSILE